jgi:putative phage-type endonuclease
MNSSTSSAAANEPSAVIPFPGAVLQAGDAYVSADRHSAARVPAPYLRVELIQGSPAWHLWRQQGIGGSDAATILGQNPYHSAAARMAERRGKRFPRPQNTAMRLGLELEPAARSWYCAAAGAVAPVCVESTRLPWLRASLDGMSADGTRLVEIKCGPAAYFHTRRTGRPPEWYKAQLQHALAITGADTIDFVCYFPPYPPIAITVGRDDVYIARLLEAEAKFWHALREPEAA